MHPPLPWLCPSSDTTPPFSPYLRHPPAFCWPSPPPQQVELVPHPSSSLLRNASLQISLTRLLENQQLPWHHLRISHPALVPLMPKVLASLELMSMALIQVTDERCRPATKSPTFYSSHTLTWLLEVTSPLIEGGSQARQGVPRAGGMPCGPFLAGCYTSYLYR